ncbi:MAG TPA: DUF4214 domain-containing protein [Acidimicrobiales bacterium]|nr:DUF4214 domain-containing protein [Acidimicrobiales bacterium]
MSPLTSSRRRPAPASGPGAPAPTLSERIVARTAGLLSGGHSRRRFLARTAVVGSALAVNPVSFILKPGTAYGAVCGSCGDGWTAFCCTINGGRNSCPPNSFVAGWWKADNAAYCCGGPRYIIDCNATCPTQCGCRCSGASCDGRRTCCNQFRYGQCNQHISCYGPVVCRVAVCITPWAYDAACSTRTLTDNATSQHGANCLSDECDSAITRRYYALGGPAGFLGVRTTVEASTPEGGGRYAAYQGGRLYWSGATGAHEVHGSLLDLYALSGYTGGPYGFPTSDVVTGAGGRARISRFQKGAIYKWTPGTFGVPAPYWNTYQAYGAESTNGALGLPTGASRTVTGGARYIPFERGRIYRRGDTVAEIHGSIFDKHQQLGGFDGALGFPVSSVLTFSDGRGRGSIFENDGVIYTTAQTGAHAVWGPLLDAYLRYGGWESDAGYPTSDRANVGDGRGTTFTTERAQVWSTPTTGAHLVPEAVLVAYRGRGGPAGDLGYPTGDVTRPSTGTYRQEFEHGVLTATSPYPAFVKAVYQDFADRAPTQAELDFIVAGLSTGGAGRAGVVQGRAQAPEYVETVVERLYVDTLGRPGDPAGTAYWVQQIRSGRRTVAQAATFFYASDEYYRGLGGGTDRTWVADLYRKLLGREGSAADLDYWTARTASRGRSSVASSFYQSTESRRTRVHRLYQDLLGRRADSAGLAYWADRIRTLGDLSLAVNLASSDEYFSRAQVRYPPPP